MLGEDEAERRADDVRTLLGRTDVDYVSVKVSSVCAQLNLAAFDAEVERVADRLRPIYTDALRYDPAKMVNLDMEQFRDLDLTVAAFRRVLGEPALAGLDAGIVLQAYIPESSPGPRGADRMGPAPTRDNGSAVKVRMSRGPTSPWSTWRPRSPVGPPLLSPPRAEVDAHYKRLLDRALQPENAGSLQGWSRQPQPPRAVVGSHPRGAPGRDGDARAGDAGRDGSVAGGCGTGTTSATSSSTRRWSASETWSRPSRTSSGVSTRTPGRRTSSDTSSR